MNSHWQDFLHQAGLHIDAQGSSIPAETWALQELPDNFICALTHYGLLAIDGPDTAKFLQGQTTCDVSTVSFQHSTTGAYCTPKGRMVANFLLAQVNEHHYRLRMPADLLEKTRSVFAKYIVFSKAEQHIDSDYLLFGLHGATARVVVDSLFGEIPEQRYQTLQKDKLVVIALDDNGTSFECWVRADTIETVWPKLSDGLALVGSTAWKLLCIRLGLAEVSSAISEEFIPQMLNLQATGAVSFKKGCYTGQEIVARMQYRGTLKKRLYHIQWLGETTPAMGTNLQSSDDGQKIGQLVNAIALGSGRCEGLAVINNAAIDQSPIFIDQTDTAIEILELPYSV